MIQLVCDAPKDSIVTADSPFLEISGWALSSDKIKEINVLIDNTFVGKAAYGIPRPDVKNAYPTISDSDISGFWFEVNFNNLGPTPQTLTIEATSLSNEKAFIDKKIILNILLDSEKPKSCPICNSGDVARKTSWRNGKYQLYHCFNCSTGFIYPLPSTLELNDYYNNLYWENLEDRINKWPIHYDTDYIDSLIKRYSKNTRSILEVGCGFGNILNGLKQKGYKVYGQEYSRKSAELGIKHFGLDITIGPLSELKTKTYDLILLRHVLEHTSDPSSDILRAAENVKKGGLILLFTPNYKSLAATVFGRFWEWFVPPAHLYYFSFESYKYLAKNSKMEIVHVETRQGDAMNIKQAWQAFDKFSVINNSTIWEQSWLNNRKILLNELLQTKNSAVLNNLGLGEELVAVLRK